MIFGKPSPSKFSEYSSMEEYEKAKDEAYQWMIEHRDYIVSQKEKYEQWVPSAKKKLMTDLIPRIHRLGARGYYGCGFHYDLERGAANLLIQLTHQFTHSGNHPIETKNWATCFADITMWKLEWIEEDIVKAEGTMCKQKRDSKGRYR